MELVKNVVRLPHKFIPRDYQRPIFDAYFKHHKKRILTLWHRRAGKDKTYINLLVAAACERVGLYLYLFPELNQARRVIWNGIDADGLRVLDHIPDNIVKRKHSGQMLIELINGSIIQLAGADRFDSLMGINPIGVVFSEYSLQNPQCWEYFKPILIENGGFAAFNFTPRGQNHAYKLYHMAVKNNNWFCQKLTVDDTRKPDGSYVMSQEKIEAEREEGMSDSLIEQEFYCSFEAALEGAYYGKDIKQAEEEGRICELAIEKNLPVYTAWDLGLKDPTAIWFIQPFHNEFRVINYYQNNNEDLPHYINYLKEFASKYRIAYAKHFAPSDIMVCDYTTKRTRWEVARDLGVEFTKAPSMGIDDGIYNVKTLFSRFWFHIRFCHDGINALRSYHAEYNYKTQIYQSQPKHDWASHAADALRYFALGWKDSYNQKFNQTNQPIRYR